MNSFCSLTRALFASALFSVLFIGPLRAQESSMVSLPVPPKELLGSLPSAPLDWKLTASRAKHLPRVRPLSLAYREYTFTPPSAGPALPSPSPVTVKFTVMDTAANPEIAASLLSQENVEGTKPLMIDAMPARRTEVAGESEHLESVALRRFLITIVIVGDTKEKAEDWLKRINLQELRRTSSETAPFDPKKSMGFAAESIDELNPSRTRTSRAIVGGEEELPSDP